MVSYDSPKNGNNHAENKILAKQLLHDPLTAWIVLLCSVGITILAWSISDNFVHERATDRFNFQVKDIEKAIYKRMQYQERVLRGGVALFLAYESVNRREWKSYVDSLDLPQNYPGLQGFGYSKVITPEFKDKHISQIRKEGFANYTIRPEGKRDIYTSIIYLEPFDWRNQRAFGYDMYSQETRRKAMARARDSGNVSISAKVTLVQETKKDVQHGFLMYLPAYKKNQPLNTQEQRRNALLGYVYSPFRINDLMRGILGARDTDINFEIYDGDKLTETSIMYDSDNVLSISYKSPQSDFSDTTSFTFGGHTWSLHFNTKPNYISNAEKSQPMMVAIGGAIIDVMLFLIIAAISRQHKRIQSLLAKSQHNVSEQETHTQIITSTVVDGIITINENGLINFVNPAVTTFFGYSENELIGKNIKMLMPDPDHKNHDNYLKAYHETSKAKIIGIGREVMGKRKDGSVFPLELAINAMDRDGKRFYVGTLRDVTERYESSKQIGETIDQMEQRANEMTLLSGLNDLLQTCQDLDEIYLVIERVMCKMFEDLSGVLYVLDDKNTNLVLASQWNNAKEHKVIEHKDCLGLRRGSPYLSTDAQPILKCQHFAEHSTPASFCIPLTAQSSTIGLLTVFHRNAEQDPIILLSQTQQDLVIAVSKQISIALANLRLRLKLEQQSIHDALTGLHNRRYLQEILPREIQRALRLEKPQLAVMMIDIDYFKKINDTHGHEAGDRVLREIARMLKTNTRNEDIVVRYGGEEFLLLFPTLDMQGAYDRAELLRSEIKKTNIEIEGIRLPKITISVGIACLPEHGSDDQTLIRLADQALYSAKAAGRDCIVISGNNDDNVGASIA